MVTGKAPLTPDGFEADAGGSRGLVYLEAQEGGDGRVALQRARFEGIPAWSADADHVGLVSRDLFFEAYLELLDKGTTALLPQQSAAADDGAAATPPAIVRSRLSRSAASSAPPERQADALLVRPEERPSAAPGIPALRITVINGDLTFVAEPLMLGHYRASKLTGTERVMNNLIGGAMDGALQRGLYPGKPESHQIFINSRTRPDNPWQLPRPRAVIVVGLGEEGSLRAADLTATVRQAVIAWSQRVAEDPGRARFLHSGHHAHRQRRHGDQRRGIGTVDRARRARSQRAARPGRRPGRRNARSCPAQGGAAALATGRCAAHHRVVRRQSRRCVAGPAHARGVVSWRLRIDRTGGQRYRSAASAARVWIPRRRVRPDYRRQPG